MHHLTLSELAHRREMTVEETWEECRRLGVPVLHGRVDRSLFESALLDPRPPLAPALGARNTPSTI